MSSLPDGTPPQSLPASGIAEIRYSLPELLREVQLERDTPAFTMEKIDQVEIAKLFSKKKRRVKPRK